MSPMQRLLLIAHPDQRHSPALQRAVALALASDAPLHVVAFVEPFATFGLLDRKVQEQTRESLLLEQRQWWEEEAKTLRGRGVKITTSVVWTTDRHRETIRQILEMQPDLVVKDIQREPALKRAFVTPLDWYLLRECPVPIHLVADARHPLPHKIVAAVDPMDPDTQISGVNEKIISAATGLALQSNAELHLLYIYDCLPAYMANSGEGGVSWSDLAEELRIALHQSFVSLADRFGVPQERRHFLMGSPIRGIADFVTEQAADVVVMGRVHHKAIDKLIGSTTEHTLYQVPSSILAVRADK
ncbi:universal stress protein [Metapseudomonas boanensis]|uniref:Universal stress protein n=1 Tax=Metapseudomonas boanensis TaxID=2822138 RepID=A0ABS5XLI1_9GAMM|nr:universal stress protein [Pseudomonas boanensis]MBT8768480.1 universal stress protein [Pseudomonas boanensis]